MRTNKKYDYVFNLLIIENSISEKQFINSFTNCIFPPNHSRYRGLDFKVKNIKLENKVIKLIIWYMVYNKSLYKKVLGIISAYDVADLYSFKNIRKWIKEIEANTQTNV